MFRAKAEQRADGSWYVEETQPSGDFPRRTFEVEFPQYSEPLKNAVYEWETSCFKEGGPGTDSDGRAVSVWGTARPVAVVWAVSWENGCRCGVETAVGNRLP